MTITDLNFTLCVSTRRHRTEDVVRLVDEAATRVSAASSTRDDHRVFWDFNNSEKHPFDEVWPAVVDWASRLADALATIEDAALALWCTIHTDSEFAGLALQAAHMQALGSRKVDLAISVYANPGEKGLESP